MTPDTLHIRIEPPSAFFEAALADVRRLEAGEPLEDLSVLSLPDVQALECVLRAETLELVRTIASWEPAHVRELARIVDRDLTTVATHIDELAERGLVDLQEEDEVKRPTVWYDHLAMDIPVTGEAN